MAQVSIDWRGPAFTRLMRRTIQRQMAGAGRQVRREYQRAVGRRWPPASRPGEFPRRRTGNLQRGVRVHVETVGAKIRLTITNIATSARGAPYPSFLETGTRRMAARPHLGPIAEATWRTVRRALGVRPIAQAALLRVRRALGAR